MPRVTVQSPTLVYIYVKGESRGKFPKLPDDGGLVQELITAIATSNLPPPAEHLSNGGGHFRALFFPEDAGKILGWLEARGVEQILYP